MSKRMPELIVGGSPRVDLLPPEIRLARRGAAIRRAMTMLLIGLVAAVGLGWAGASLLAGAAQSRLEAEQAITTDLLLQQQQYIEVRQNAQQIELIDTATRVGTSTAIDWQAFVGSLMGGFTDGMSVRSFTIQSATPIAGFAQSSSPLATPRVATVLIAVVSPSLPTARDWMRSLGAIPGVSDVAVDSIQSETAGFLTTLTVSVDSTVLAHAQEATS